MSKVKLIVVQGNGTSYAPYIGGTDRVIDIDLQLPENENIVGIVRTDFETQYDEALKEETTRSSDDLTPVIPYEHVNNLVGKLLTLVDSMFTDKEQRKAAKDLFRETAWSWYVGHTDSLTEPWRLDKFPNYKKAFDLDK